MVPTLIVLGLLALGVGIVAFATRQPVTRQDVIVAQHTAWNDPMASAADTVASDPFAHAPLPTSTWRPEAVQPEHIPLERAS